MVVMVTVVVVVVKLVLVVGVPVLRLVTGGDDASCHRHSDCDRTGGTVGHLVTG